MAHKLLMISTMWDNEFLYDVIEGIKKRFEEIPVIHILNAYDLSYEESTLSKEQEIYRLCNWEDYEGVFIAANSIGNIDYINRLIAEIRQSNIPIVSMGVEFENTICVGVDNRRAIYRIVEHMIKKHSCRVFDFIGGPTDNEESLRRYKGFCDCLRDYNIEIEEDRVLFLGYLYEDGFTAYNAYKEKNLHLPDAVICANDTMALGYCDAAGEDGNYAPTDFIISGFDDYEPGREYVPSITTVNMNWHNMGYIGADLIIKSINGEVIADKSYSEELIMCNQSCGCKELNKDYRAEAIERYRNIKNREDVVIGHRYVLQTLCSAMDVNQMQKNLGKVIEILEIDDISLCLNKSIMEADGFEKTRGYDEEILACTKEGISEIKHERQLVPDAWLDDVNKRILFFSPLYFGKNTFGYAVVPYGPELVNVTKKRYLFENLSIALEAIRQRRELNLMNQKLQDLYVHDGLTGLYNRFGYFTYGKAFYEDCSGKAYVAYLDVNCLKQINDRFGHEMGDLAITSVADAIKNVFPKENICVRMGGDEFLVMGRFINEEDLLSKKQGIAKYLENINREKKIGFVISASMGLTWRSSNTGIAMDELVRAADEAMYLEKAKREPNLVLL